MNRVDIARAHAVGPGQVHRPAVVRVDGNRQRRPDPLLPERRGVRPGDADVADHLTPGQPVSVSQRLERVGPRGADIIPDDDDVAHRNPTAEAAPAEVGDIDGTIPGHGRPDRWPILASGRARLDPNRVPRSAAVEGHVHSRRAPIGHIEIIVSYVDTIAAG